MATVLVARHTNHTTYVQAETTLSCRTYRVSLYIVGGKSWFYIERDQLLVDVSCYSFLASSDNNSHRSPPLGFVPGGGFWVRLGGLFLCTRGSHCPNTVLAVLQGMSPVAPAYLVYLTSLSFNANEIATPPPASAPPSTLNPPPKHPSATFLGNPGDETRLYSSTGMAAAAVSWASSDDGSSIISSNSSSFSEGSSCRESHPLSPSNKNDDDDEAPPRAAVTIISKVAEFAQPRSYLFFGSVSRSWRDGWESSKRPKVTSYVTPGTFATSPTTAAGDGSSPTATPTPAAAAAAATTTTTAQLLRYSFENGLPRNRVGVCEALARTGNLDLLKLAREMGCPFHIRTATAAAERGHLHVLRWIRARENGRCPWHENTCMAAAQGESKRARARANQPTNQPTNLLHDFGRYCCRGRLNCCTAVA